MPSTEPVQIPAERDAGRYNPLAAAGPDPAWTLVLPLADPRRRRVDDTLCTLGAHGVATRGIAEERTTDEPLPSVLADGVYAAEPAGGLLPGPVWTALHIDPPPVTGERILDLRAGVLLRCESDERFDVPIRTERFVSLTRPGVVALRAVGALGRLRPGSPLTAPGTVDSTTGMQEHRRWMRVTAPGGAGIATVATQRLHRSGGSRTVERIAALVMQTKRAPALEAAVAVLDAAAEAGFDRLLREQRAAWARRWQDVDVRIPDDPRSQLLVRYALFQLWSNVGRHDESAVGARGLSGPGYAGHVFWDADAFVLPAVVSIDPAAARAMVRYRLNRLAAARAFAIAGGHDGARFPWESAASGADVTPRRSLLGPAEVEILTGQLEEHITADVAWGLARYLAWTGGPANTAELTLLADTARYWAARCRRDADGTAHIDAVIGPDEYHERVDDNAFTNVMARWNLRAGADAADRLRSGYDGARWREVANALVDGFDAATGRYEQFAGYFRLEPLLMSQVAQPPVAVDLLLGRDRVSRSQLIKQPDVLMLHHLVPGEVHPGSLPANLDFYLPRTAHGSSLSPAVSAALLARAGRPDPALRMLEHALVLDVDDATGMTESGLHLATLASVWTALLAGFGGVSVSGGVLTVDPRLPSCWGRLQLRFRCLGRRVRLEIDPSAVRVSSDGPLHVRAGPGVAKLVTTGGAMPEKEPRGHR